ncbi:unnamed protein product [Leptosia nina]|uniref:Uncharacterized protein n=1 Tax=Leptosia nina TaxID=320188 RepID=A0AAV1JZT7_9NEOP
MYIVGVLWLLACVAALPSTERPKKPDIVPTKDKISDQFHVKSASGEDKNDNDRVSPVPPLISPLPESLNKETDINNPEEQEIERENLEEQQQEESANPNFVEENNEYNNNAGFENEPVQFIPEQVNDEASSPFVFKWPSFLSNIFSYLPSWPFSFPIRWPFNRPLFYRTSYYPEYPEYADYNNYLE